MDLLAQINTYFDANSELPNHPRYKGIFNCTRHRPAAPQTLAGEVSNQNAVPMAGPSTLALMFPAMPIQWPPIPTASTVPQLMLILLHLRLWQAWQHLIAGEIEEGQLFI